jgi:hypothetical protein
LLCRGHALLTSHGAPSTMGKNWNNEGPGGPRRGRRGFNAARRRWGGRVCEDRHVSAVVAASPGRAWTPAHGGRFPGRSALTPSAVALRVGISMGFVLEAACVDRPAPSSMGRSRGTEKRVGGLPV